MFLSSALSLLYSTFISYPLYFECTDHSNYNGCYTCYLLPSYYTTYVRCVVEIFGVDLCSLHHYRRCDLFLLDISVVVRYI